MRNVRVLWHFAIARDVTLRAEKVVRVMSHHAQSARQSHHAQFLRRAMPNRINLCQKFFELKVFKTSFCKNFLHKSAFHYLITLNNLIELMRLIWRYWGSSNDSIEECNHAHDLIDLTKLGIMISIILQREFSDMIQFWGKMKATSVWAEVLKKALMRMIWEN